jgi:hypothetical protein
MERRAEPGLTVIHTMTGDDHCVSAALNIPFPTHTAHLQLREDSRSALGQSRWLSSTQLGNVCPQIPNGRKSTRRQ